ncbi:prolyl aminopeptidase, partial [Gammaproteobacteria bacterium]|nr:prolyl aminopeptidase [Gammaproteobacteria bacterium]
NPDGKPAVFLHGGPGGGGSTQVRRFFDPDKYHVVIFDQRGCGRSLPHGCLENNTTWDLVEDIENLKVKLGIKQWLVFGGSWGSTLALAYSQTYPDSVSEMVLRGIFMLRKKELDWFYQYGASNIFPEAWQKFIEPIEHNERDDLMAAYHKIFLSNNEEKKLNAAIAWSRWEGSTSSLSYNPDMANSFSDPKFALAFALIENHYFVNKGFLEHENQLIESGINIIRDIPTVIVQGRYDIVCPISTAWELSQNWPEAELIVAPSSGHTAFELEITHELIKATNTFADSYE